MKKIVYTRPDGGVTVIHPNINSNEKLSEDEAFERAKKDIPADALNVSFVDSVPTDRTFRDAWKADLSVDMVKARVIHRDRLRLARRLKFEVLDAVWMKATATGDTVGAANAEAKRQALRDAPQFAAIDLATTPDQLKAAVPPILVDP